jgi:hypothetical protein
MAGNIPAQSFCSKVFLSWCQEGWYLTPRSRRAEVSTQLAIRCKASRKISKLEAISIKLSLLTSANFANIGYILSILQLRCFDEFLQRGL